MKTGHHASKPASTEIGCVADRPQRHFAAAAYRLGLGAVGRYLPLA
jgi:hypothetical protein